MKLQLSHATGVFALLAASLLNLAPNALAQGDNFAVSVSTDAMQPAPLPVVGIGQFGLAQQVLGDLNGHTEAIEIDLDAPAVVRLEEVPLTTYGGQFTAVSIGQHFTWVPNAEGPADGRRLHYFQPVARLIDFYAPYAVSDYESGWSASGHDNATYGFQAHTAELPTREIISNFLAHKIDTHVELFQHGLLLRCSQWVDLGALGINFRINREGYDYGFAGPQVHAYSLTNPGFQSLATPVLKGVDSANVSVQLYGYLAPGDNLILFEDPNPGGVFPADPLGDVYSTANGGNTCEIPAPSCTSNATCAPDMPTGAVMGGATTCSNFGSPIGKPVTAACGTSVTQQQCTTFSGGVSFGGTIGQVLEVSISGEVGGSVCTSVQVNGGYRAQAWQCFRVCCRQWECTYVPWYSVFPRDYTDTTCCVIEGQIETTSCQFDDCK